MAEAATLVFYICWRVSMSRDFGLIADNQVERDGWSISWVDRMDFWNRDAVETTYGPGPLCRWGLSLILVIRSHEVATIIAPTVVHNVVASTIGSRGIGRRNALLVVIGNFVECANEWTLDVEYAAVAGRGANRVYVAR